MNKPPTIKGMIIDNNEPESKYSSEEYARIDEVNIPVSGYKKSQLQKDQEYYCTLNAYQANLFRKDRIKSAGNKAANEIIERTKPEGDLAETSYHEVEILKGEAKQSAEAIEAHNFLEPESIDLEKYLQLVAMNFLINSILTGNTVKESYNLLAHKNMKQGDVLITDQFIGRAKKREFYNLARDNGTKSMLGIFQKLDGDIINRIKKKRMWSKPALQYYCTGSVSDVLNKLYRVITLVNSSYQLTKTLKQVKELNKKTTKLVGENKKLAIQNKKLKLKDTEITNKWHKLVRDLTDKGTKQIDIINKIAVVLPIEEGTIKQYSKRYKKGTLIK